jgi:hypothetical protein
MKASALKSFSERFFSLTPEAGAAGHFEQRIFAARRQPGVDLGDHTLEYITR